MKINWFALNEIKPFDKPEEEKTPKIKEGWLNEAKDYYYSLDEMTEEPYRLTGTGFTDCEVELYQLNSTQAHIGRGVKWGEIPQAPEASFYDFLQPFVTQEELPTSSSYQLFCLRLTGTAPGKWQGEIRAPQGKISVSKTLTFEVLPLLLPTQTAPTLELWQYPFAVARYYQIEPKDYFNKAHCERIADLAIGQPHLGDQTVFRQWCEQRRTKGLATSIYNCVGDYPAMFLYSHPLESQWVIWNTVAYGADGFLRWTLDAWVKDPLVNGSHWYWESGDPFLLYPGTNGTMMSLRFQQMQQALNDSRKYLFLQNKQPALVSEVTRLLDGWAQLSGKTNDYGAQVPFSENETLQLIQTIQQMHDLLEKGARAYLKESNK